MSSSTYVLYPIKASGQLMTNGILDLGMMSQWQHLLVHSVPIAASGHCVLVGSD